jgi:CDP-glucose 4,6-dehydratase
MAEENQIGGTMFGDIYKGRRVLVTGQTGFKGSWLTFWLLKMGAHVLGISRHPPTNPCHYDILGLHTKISDIRADLRYGRDMREIKTEIDDFKPEIVFHLAAQAIVAKTFGDPQGTFEGNIMGALNLLDACRYAKSVKAFVMITTDKVYEEKPMDRGFNEFDELGALDPYSASKVCVEIISRCYQAQYFPMLAIARAGNVIGGGDWAYKRLIPDIVRAAIRGENVEIHTPYATRPWQHVLEPLMGYLMLGERLLMGHKEFAGPWNFGPEEDISVLNVMEIASECWPKIKFKIEPQEHHPSMIRLLKLDSTKARKLLGWTPVWDIRRAVKETILWYKYYYENNNIKTDTDIYHYLIDLKRLHGERDDAP